MNKLRPFVNFSLLVLAGCSFLARDTVLKVPIRFEEGYSLSRSFTVDDPHQYDLIIAFRKDTPIDVRRGPPPDDFAVQFVVRSGGDTVAEGTNESDDPKPSLHSKNYTARYLSTFQAVPGRRYELTFRVTRALPSLAATKPVVMIARKTYPPHESHE